MTIKLLEQGHTVIPILRDPAITIDLINRDNCYPILVDLNDPRLGEKIDRIVGDRTIDVVVFNAAPNLNRYTLSDTNEHEIRQTINTIVVSHYIVFQSVLHLLAKDASIVAVSSRMGSITRNASGEFRELPRPPAYKIAKAGLNMLMAIIQDEYPAMKCVSVHPGLMQTKMGSRGGRRADDVANDLIEFIENHENNSLTFNDLETGEQIPW